MERKVPMIEKKRVVNANKPAQLSSFVNDWSDPSISVFSLENPATAAMAGIKQNLPHTAYKVNNKVERPFTTVADTT